MPEKIWTIGHSTRSLAELLELLEEFEIQLLADVRQFPMSRRYPHFNEPALKKALERKKIAYEHFLDLGGRRKALKDSPNSAWRHEAFRGYADYMETEPFREGIQHLLQLASKKRTAIMCAEAVWWRCHRGLVSDYLKVMGIEVCHIMAPGKAEPHPFTGAASVYEGRLSYAAAQAELL